MDYKGWNLIDNVIIVCRPKQKKTDWSEAQDFYHGYIVDAKNKKQLKTARGWANGYNNKDKQQIEFKYKNEDFKLELYGSASGSSQGGKLSFWSCLIYKDNEKFNVGINADLLIDVLKNSTVINGVIQEPVLFASNSGKTGVLHKDMPQYKDALKDMQKKAEIKTKTSKHIIGHNYYTLTENHIYLGDLYDWFEPVKEVVRRSYSWNNKEETIGYKISDKPTKVKLFHSVSDKDNDIHSIKEFCNTQIKNKNLWNCGLDEQKDKLPSRTEGNIIWSNDMSADDWDKFIINMRKIEIYDSTHRTRYNTNEIEEISIGLWRVGYFGLSPYADKPPVFSDEEIKIFGDKLIR